MSDADITIPSLYKLGRPPSQEISQELIARIRQLEVSKSLDLSDETIERIANELYFYRNMREATPEWKKAQQTSLKDLSAASKAALQMVEVIRENILRVDNASMYHQDVVERYAASMELRRQDYPNLLLCEPERLSQKAKTELYVEGISSLEDIAEALETLAAACKKQR